MQSVHALAALLAPMAESVEDEGGGFHSPTLDDFFPAQLFGDGTWWGPTRINLIGLLMTGVVSLIFVLAFRNPKVVPGKLQNIIEMALDVVHSMMVFELLGEKGRRFAPLLVTLFFMILAFNVTGIIPLLHMPATAIIGVPLVLAVVSYATFNYAGIKAKGFGGYLKSSVVPPGVPPAMLVLVIPIEFVSTFILRPFTLAVRLMANMMSGHILLVLFFSATSYFLFDSEGLMRLFGVASYAAGFIFTLFECLVILLQAYVFTLLTAVYIDGALSAEH